MLIVCFFAYKKLAQFALRCALPPRRSESPVCANDNKPSCVLHLLGWFIGSRGFSSLERRPEFWVLQWEYTCTAPANRLAINFWIRDFFLLLGLGNITREMLHPSSLGDCLIEVDSGIFRRDLRSSCNSHRSYYLEV